jgi:clan AA aspartic protease (TIGR02281 family)
MIHIVLLLFFLINHTSSYSQLSLQDLIASTPPYEIDDIKEALKKEDFNSLSILLKSNDFKVTMSNLNYNRGSQYVIAEIECEKSILGIKSKFNPNFSSAVKTLKIRYTEDNDFGYKTLDISIRYDAVNTDFLQYFYKWKDMNWTYFTLGKNHQSNEVEIGNATAGYGLLGNQLKKISSDSIKMQTFGDWDNKKPLFKKMRFVNLNENLGVLADYSCELSNPETRPDYLVPENDTAYTFDLQMVERYPIFSSKTNNQSTRFQNIPLIKSGKTYFIIISIGDKKYKYILDTGASDMTIDEASYNDLIRRGIITMKDKLPDGDYQIADGTIKTYKRTLIPEIRVGNISVSKVPASVVPSGQPLLLGKSFLDNFKTWKINNLKNALIVEVE